MKKRFKYFFLNWKRNKDEGERIVKGVLHHLIHELYPNYVDLGISLVKLNVTRNKIRVIIYLTKPLLLIGEGAESIKLLQSGLETRFKKVVELHVREYAWWH